MPSKAVRNETTAEAVKPEPTEISLRYTGLFQRVVCQGLLFTRGETVTLPISTGNAIAAFPNFEIVESDDK